MVRNGITPSLRTSRQPPTDQVSCSQPTRCICVNRSHLVTPLFLQPLVRHTCRSGQMLRHGKHKQYHGGQGSIEMVRLMIHGLVPAAGPILWGSQPFLFPLARGDHEDAPLVMSVLLPLFLPGHAAYHQDNAHSAIGNPQGTGLA
jgi:hypothetical protein